MLEHVKNDIRKMVNADEASIEFVLSHFTVEYHKKNTVLLRDGEVCKHCYFINKGCVQIYHIDDKGNEATRDIYFEGHWMTNVESFSKEIPSTEFYKTIEPTETLTISRTDFFRLIAEVPQFMEAYRQILETSYSKSIDRVNTFNALDAKERYHWVTEQHPMILTRVPARIVASYIGITKETLSRLRTKS